MFGWLVPPKFLLVSLRRGPLFFESNESGLFFNNAGYYILNHRLPVFKLT